VDTITQIALGAAVGEATLGKQVGRSALLWGGICGLLPDLDVLVPLGDAVKNFTYHRGPSHSLFVLAVLTPLMVGLILKLRPQTAPLRKRWYILVYLAFATHVLLDSLTVYGTQIFWPLRTPPIMWSTIFIIDPAYSVPLLIGVIAALLLRRHRRLGHVANAACLALSTVYLIWSAGAKLAVEAAARDTLERQQISFERVLTVPTPFNTLLWRVLVMDQRGYHEGFTSLLDETRDIRFVHYPNDRSLLKRLEGHWPVERLKWFTHGFLAVEQLGNDIVVSDLRMGLEPSYVFSFKVGELGFPNPTPSAAQRVFKPRGWHQLKWVWQRIWNDPSEKSVQIRRLPVVPDQNLPLRADAGARPQPMQREHATIAAL